MRKRSKEQEGESVWWEKYPPKEKLFIWIIPKTAPLEEDLSIAEKRSRAIAQNTDAVDLVIEYILANADRFPSINDVDMVGEFHILGYLNAHLTPAECGALTESGLIDQIFLDPGKMKVELLSDDDAIR